MKKLLFPFLIMVALFVISGCSEKFNVAAPYKNITVIYSFLDCADTAHYVRVQKAFLDQNQSALVMAKDSDSSFYAHINVRINRIKLSDTGHVFDTIHLTRVNLDAEGYPKQPGVFFDAPNYAYKFKNTLDPNFFYRIVVTNLITGQVDSSNAPIIDDVTPGVLLVDMLDDTVVNREGIDFSNPAPSQVVEMNIAYTPIPGFNFYGQPSPVYLAWPIIRFNWVDSNLATGAKTQNYYDYTLNDNVMATNAIDIKTKNSTFYSTLLTGMGPAPTNIVRLMDRCDIFVYLTTYDYYNYQQSTLTQGVGLTGNEIEPIYTNVKGANALGLFTSRALQSGKINITTGSIQALADSPNVASLKVIGTIYH